MPYVRIMLYKEGDKNLNTDFYENFEQALSLSEKEFSRAELIEMLKSDDIKKMQIAALKFDEVKDNNDVQVLLSRLTGCDGKVREAVALKLNQAISRGQVLDVFAKSAPEIFADATIDINANICRCVVDSAVILEKYPDFSKKYTDKIVKFAQEALYELDQFIFRDKKYVINKQIFKLYWCLEALKYFYSYVDEDILQDILTKCANQTEYTIREKTAQILYSSGKFSELAKKLEADENYYVRAVFAT